MKKNFVVFSIIAIALFVSMFGCSNPLNTSKDYTKYINNAGEALDNVKVEATEADTYKYDATYLVPNIPYVEDQGQQGSCVGFGTSSAWSQHLGLTSSNRVSPSWVYNQILVNGCNGGSYVEYGLDLMKAKKAQSILQMPYDDSICEPTNPPEGTIARLTDWAQLTLTVDNLKYHILNYGALAMRCTVKADFYSFTGNAVYDSSLGKTYGGHCMYVIGWDDTKLTDTGYGAFKIRNSWGPAWGIYNGDMYISYGLATSTAVGFGAYNIFD